MSKYLPLLGLFLTLIGGTFAYGATPPPVLPIGDSTLTGWSGVKATANGGEFAIPGSAEFSYPSGSKGWYVHGFRDENDSTRDWRTYYGVQFDVFVPAGRKLDLKATIFTPTADLRQNYLPESSASATVAGGGWQKVTLPFTVFDFDPELVAFMEFVQRFRLSGKFADGSTGLINFKDLHLIRAPSISLTAPIQGAAVLPGQTATYDVSVGNCTDSTQNVKLAIKNDYWNVMPAAVSPSELVLKPGSSTLVKITVQVPTTGVPEGAHETETLVASSNTASGVARLDLITARDVDRPCIQLTSSGWDWVRDKVTKYDWAKKQADALTAEADAWQVPTVPISPLNYSTDAQHVYVFKNIDFVKLPDVATAWQLTRNKAYAEKVALFLRRLSDPVSGYPATFAGTDEGGPQEGQNFQAVAIAYDDILDAGVLSDADKLSIARTFRLYMESMEPNLTVGNVGNWSVAQSTACLMCALAIGDLSEANRYIYGPCGYTDFVGKGIMDDGWWWECSTGYNLWVASELTQAGVACQPWGIDLIDMKVPASYSPNTITAPWALDPPYGVCFDKWGPNHLNYRTVKQLWDAIPAAADYRGIVFGTNDGHQETVGGSRLELAYYVYRDPAYATLIKLNNTRDLIYGVPDLVTDNRQDYLKSGYAENIGYTLLRSQTPGRDPRDQIQVVLKTGTQGGFHGHFDRASLDQVIRYGREYWNPETTWWGYPNYLYKFYVQTSVASNMVVVDQKMQEAVPSKQLFFYSGKAIQASAVETNARWSDPPYGGMQYFPGDTFAGQMRKNVQSIPLATDRKYGELGPYSDRVLQRRLGVVTDDYVIIADYLKAEQPHTFDNIFQMKDLTGIDAPSKAFLRHDAQFNPDPHSSAQFITDCDWYTVTAPAVAKFSFRYGPGANLDGERVNYEEPGLLNVDLHSLWPQNQQLMIGTAPSPLGTQQWVTYNVVGDGKVLQKGETGAWILGQQNIDVSVAGLKTLTLQASTAGAQKKSLFWAGARLITADGRSVSLASLAASSNIIEPPIAGKDYYGGPIKVAGVPYDDALPAQPSDVSKPGVITIPLTGLNAVRFQATLGADYPLGDESQRRKVYSIRSQGNTARFLTVLEPYEDVSVIKSAVATGPDDLVVELTDGRSQAIHISGLDGDGTNITVTFTESKAGQVLRTETTGSSEN